MALNSVKYFYLWIFFTMYHADNDAQSLAEAMKELENAVHILHEQDHADYNALHCYLQCLKTQSLLLSTEDFDAYDQSAEKKQKERLLDEQ